MAKTAASEIAFRLLPDLGVGKHGAVFADVSAAEIAPAAFADPAAHFPL